jgi:hypothetical protein
LCTFSSFSLNALLTGSLCVIKILSGPLAIAVARGGRVISAAP